MPLRTASWAAKLTDHRAWPSGAGPQTMATTAATWVLSKSLFGFGRGSSESAASNPWAKYRLPTRETSRGYPPTAVAAERTEKPWWRRKRTRMRRQVRGAIRTRPDCMRLSRARSTAESLSSVNRFDCTIPRCRSKSDPSRKPPGVISTLGWEH
jgi:hypothetical protein